jgi:uncharacterized protein YbbC (DUF1343 family)
MQKGVKMMMVLTMFAVCFGCAGLRRTVLPPKVRAGLDVLEGEDFARLKGKRVGLITNHSGMDHRGQHIFDLMLKSKNVKIVALFAPEHGFKGSADQLLKDQKEEKTGMTIYSLYGKTNRPTKEMLKDVDVLVFDIQDIGARFYTYISTMAMCMEEAAKNKIKFIVLDHPNPIGGIEVDGPIQDEGLYGKFTSYFPMPVKHGMTIGELAWMFNEHFGIWCDLEVVKMEGWKRTMYFDETGQPWVNPSPNIRNVTQEILYPGFALTEGTNVSVGRGTDTPFEIYGAPYINAEQLTEEMRSRNLPGLAFEPVSFTPTSSIFQKQQCNGFRVRITDRNAVQIVPAGLHLIDALYKLYPETYKLNDVYGLVGSQAVMDMLKARKPVAEIVQSYQPALRKFIEMREKYLLYR